MGVLRIARQPHFSNISVVRVFCIRIKLGRKVNSKSLNDELEHVRRIKYRLHTIQQYTLNNF